MAKKARVQQEKFGKTNKSKIKDSVHRTRTGASNRNNRAKAHTRTYKHL